MVRKLWFKQWQQSLHPPKVVQPKVSQASREAPVLDEVVCFLRGVLAEILTAWLPERCTHLARGSEWQEDQLPAIRTQIFVRFHAFLPQP
jgi:hypothetical protein